MRAQSLKQGTIGEGNVFSAAQNRGQEERGKGEKSTGFDLVT